MTRFNHVALFAVLCGLTASSGLAAADDEIVPPRDLSFFGFFASKENQHKFDGRLACEYGHPVKGVMCPPVEDPRPPPATKEDESVLETFSRCLDDPDLPECRALQVGEVTPAAQVASAPAHLRNLFGETISPTVDDCGGNMFDPRFCASEQPSVSSAPSITSSPTSTIVGSAGPDGNEDGPIGTTGPDGNEGGPIGTTGPDGSEETIIGTPGPDGSDTTTIGTPGPDGSDTTIGTPGPDGSDTTIGTPGPDGSDTTIGTPGPDGSDTTISGTPGPDGSDTTISGTPGPDGSDTTISGTPGPDGSDTTISGTPGPDGFESSSLTSGTPGPDGTDFGSGVPTMAPTNCEGRDGVVNMHLRVGKVYPEIPPLELFSRSDKVAILQLNQTWADEVSFISAQFYQNGNLVCPSDANVKAADTAETPMLYSIDCNDVYWANMILYVNKPGFNTGSIVQMPSPCNEADFVTDSIDTVSYEITVSCVCDPSAVSSAPSFAPSFSPSVAPSAAPSAAPSSAPSSAPSAEIQQRRVQEAGEEGEYHCSAMAHPCSEGPNYVNICHYSTRIGYRTYCVPEGDSEIVRFYKTDYCGPCTGGYAVDETGA